MDLSGHRAEDVWLFDTLELPGEIIWVMQHRSSLQGPPAYRESRSVSAGLKCFGVSSWSPERRDRETNTPQTVVLAASLVPSLERYYEVTR